MIATSSLHMNPNDEIAWEAMVFGSGRTALVVRDPRTGADMSVFLPSVAEARKLVDGLSEALEKAIAEVGPPIVLGPEAKS